MDESGREWKKLKKKEVRSKNGAAAVSDGRLQSAKTEQEGKKCCAGEQRDMIYSLSLHESASIILSASMSEETERSKRERDSQR